MRLVSLIVALTLLAGLTLCWYIHESIIGRSTGQYFFLGVPPAARSEHRHPSTSDHRGIAILPTNTNTPLVPRVNDARVLAVGRSAAYRKLLKRMNAQASKLRWNDARPIHALPSQSARLKTQPVNFTSVKIFVYPLSRAFNYGIVEKMSSAQQWSYKQHLMAEQYLLERLLADPIHRTDDPDEAHMYYVPFFAAARRHSHNGESFANAMLSELTYWKRNNGADHIFFIGYDYGACEEYRRKTAKGLRRAYMRLAILSSTYGDSAKPECFQRGRDIVLPAGVRADAVGTALELLRDRGITGPDSGVRVPAKMELDDHRRSTLVHFRGQMSHSIRNVRQRLRDVILRNSSVFGIDDAHPLFRPNSTLFDDVKGMTEAHFCLCPAGYAPWSPRVFIAAAAGCIPVIVSDDILLPWESLPGTATPKAGALQWENMSVRVAETDIVRLAEILTSISPKRRVELRTRLLQAAPQLWLLEQRLQGVNAAWGGTDPLSPTDGYDFALVSFVTEYNRRRVEAGAALVDVLSSF